MRLYSFSAWGLLCLPLRSIVLRANAVNPAFFAVLESVPSDVFEVGEFHVAPFFYFLCDVFCIVFAFEFFDLVCFLVGDADHSVVEIDFVMFVNESHIVGFQRIGSERIKSTYALFFSTISSNNCRVNFAKVLQDATISLMSVTSSFTKPLETPPGSPQTDGLLFHQGSR